MNTNVVFRKGKEITDKASSGYGDVDLVAENLMTNDLAAVGVSGWHRERLTTSYAKIYGDRLFDITSRLAERG